MQAVRMVVVVCLVLMCVIGAVAQGTYTQFDVPASQRTLLYAINNSGALAGSYVDENSTSHGFILSGGIYHTIDYPGGDDTAILGINDAGQAVGYTYVAGNVFGFSYDLTTQTFNAVNYPGGRYTYPYAINNAGTIVGSYVNSTRELSVGFTLEGSTYRNVQPPGTAEQFATVATGISTAGVIAGYAGHPYNFLSKHGEYKRIVVPESKAYVYGISPAGTALVGVYGTAGFGFVYQNKVLTSLQFPMGLGTEPHSINDTGVVVGSFSDTSLTYHGFLWTPTAAEHQ